MAELKEKYGFPLFTKETSSVYLGYEKKLIVSDIWSFWNYIIKKKNFHKKFLLSLLEQAKNFYEAAEAAPISSKPLLFYYSFLNLAKIILIIEHRYGMTKQYMHGIVERNNRTFRTSTVQFYQHNPNKVMVATELYELFNNVTVGASLTVKLKDLLKHCVGIHRAYSEIYKTPEVFRKVSNMEYYRNGKTIGLRAKVKCKLSEVSALRGIGYNIVVEENTPYLVEELLTNRYEPAREDYYSLSQQITNKGIWYCVEGNKYKKYLSISSNDRYPIEIIIYSTMFYLGSITRYKPYLFDDIFDETEQWLMSEFLKTQPSQFLYLATAKILGLKVLKPDLYL